MAGRESSEIGRGGAFRVERRPLRPPVSKKGSLAPRFSTSGRVRDPFTTTDGRSISLSLTRLRGLFAQPVAPVPRTPMFRGQRYDEHVAALNEVDQREWALRKDVSPRSRE